MSEIAKAYDPSKAEKKWYAEWEKRGYFAGQVCADKESYTIVIPPPNVTGILTLGHVLNNTLQDVLIRFERMRGKGVCWVPGTDHAGIATQSKVEAYLREKEKLTRYDLGREKFLERVWQWREEYGRTIIRQLRSLGVACDWRRERFTLDDGLSRAVQEVFIRLYEKGLIYKGKRIINWCPKSRTALSDEEVIYRAEKGKLWYFHYPLADGSGTICVATTRPETMLGDTGVAVNPEDERYRDLVGKMVRLPIVDREIPIVADSFVDPKFGTGAVKVTPAHDPNDYEMGVRHNFEALSVMNDDASMNEAAGEAFCGLDRFACRKAVVAEMERLNLLDKIEEHDHQVGYSERGGVPVEPRISEQWFVRMKPLAEPAIQAVAEGRIRFHPERWVKTYNHWMENIRDWCISRQLWWGHRIPAYYCEGCGKVVVAREMPTSCDCGSRAFHQDEDVLDTWFSSWLWPFSVFDWPTENEELRHFYPTQTLVTGPDIIFFWVARMIMAGLEFMGDIPFKDVYFTSIIRDEIGRKMSKSLNNSPDPLEVIKTYGTDALRFTVLYIAPMGQDLCYSNQKCEIGRNFANKLWNAARFRRLQGGLTEGWSNLDELTASMLRPDDRWVIAEIDQACGVLTRALSDFDFHAYVIDLYEVVWNKFCDWYVESAKAAFYSTDQARRETTLRVFDYVFDRILRLMHPVMPFVTEELYHQMGYVEEADSIMNATWPEALGEEVAAALGLSPEFLALVAAKFELIRAGRNLRNTYRIPMAQKIAYFVRPTSAAFARMLAEDEDSMRLLLNADPLIIDAEYEPTGQTPSAVGRDGLIYMPLEGVVDVEEERQRLARQEEEILRGLNGLEKKLTNEKFLARAPSEVVKRERARQAELREKLTRVQELQKQI